MQLDRKDFALISALQDDASKRLEDLARIVGMAPSSVHERLRRLKSAGVIRRWTIDCDEGALGRPLLAFVGVRSTRPCAALRSALEAIPAIEECHSVAGNLSMLLKVRVENSAALMTLVEQVRGIPGVDATETTVALATQFARPCAPRAEPSATT